ncbi:MAG TPA: hypothetical protein PK629_00035 [Oscillospiraceae bacterium]|nr:hypothetical protein [Oscillospiraceae bacterium]HPF56019.1 hypothetical protein [Clostridiales bacterium]HPK35492.1 hypothetical protein [Oscillospiraceae bacterium]HPR76030.1 hypothetical protein [Oscillospiraceae bacterium]
MKRITLITLILMLAIALLLSGCSFGKPQTEGIKTSEGEILVGEQLEWPGSSMGGLSKPNATITSIIKDNDTENCTVSFSAMSSETAAQYIENLKQQGYLAVIDVSDTDGLFYSGANAAGVCVLFTYTNSSQEGIISYTPSQGSVPSQVSTAGQTGVSSQETTSNQTGVTESVDSSSEDEVPIDMTDVSPWPDGFLDGVTELAGKIMNVYNQNDENITVELFYVEKSDFEAYVSTLKQNGYTVDVDEGKDSYSYDFRAYNENGDYVNAYMYYESKTATVYMEKAVNE